MVNERLALPAARTGTRAVATSTTANALTVTGQPELPELFAPSIAAGHATDGRMHSAQRFEFDDVGIPIPDAAPSWVHETGTDPFSSDPSADFSWRIRPTTKFDRIRQGSASLFRRAGQRMLAALLTAALLGTFGIGWVGGSASYRLFVPSPAATPLKQRSNAGTHADNRASSDTSHEKVAPATRKLAAIPASKPEPAPIALESGVRSLPHLMPVPETRPMTISGWTVRDVSGTTATLEGPDGAWRAARGDIVPGLGRVDSIVRWGNYWLISTSRGLVASE
jgi:hypothetical protein